MPIALRGLSPVQRSSALAISVIIVLISASNNPARGQTDNQTSTGFYWPTGSKVLQKEETSWLAGGCSWSNPKSYQEGYYHIGVDISGTVSDSVYAIADGYVNWISRNGWKGEKDGQYNIGLLIVHRLSDDTEFTAVYGHIVSEFTDEDAKKKTTVTAGQKIGIIGAYDYSHPHLHFGIRPGTSTDDPYGRIECPAVKPTNLDTNGFVDPIEWITTKRPKSAATTPVPVLPAPPPATPVASSVPAPPPGSKVIDDSSAAFARSGKPEFWRTASGGNGGSFIWTQNNHSKQDNTGTWTISVPERGLYEVFVCIPSDRVNTTNALYEIRHAGKTDVVTVDQSKHRDTWHSLGTFDFEGKEAEYVRLTDATGERDQTTHIAFDAIAIVQREQNFFEKIWSHIQRLGREVGERIEQILEWLDKLRNPQAMLDQLIKDVVDQIVRALLLELQKYLQGLCGSITFAVLPLIMLARRKRTHD